MVLSYLIFYKFFLQAVLKHIVKHEIKTLSVKQVDILDVRM